VDKRKKSGVRAAAVLLVALAAGHLVQTIKAEKAVSAVQTPKAIEKVSAGPEAAAPAPVLPVTASLTGPAPAAEPVAPADETTPTVVAAEPIAPASETPALDAPVLAALPDPVAIAPDAATPVPPKQDAAFDPAPPVASQPAPATATAECKDTMTLGAGPLAMISVSIDAPCRAGERVVLRHAGLVVAEQLTDTGTLTLDLPALQTQGEVSALFPDADVLRDSVAVPDAARTRRFAVQWMAEDAFQLLAFENGASYGDPGAVWTAAPVSPNGGFVMALGNPMLDLPMMAQVYTYPTNAALSVELAIEAAVTEMTCDRDLLGETLSTLQGVVTVTDLTLAMPDCDAVGDILVLNNPGQDVTLAAAD
jgi:hypothetical protein